MGKRFGVFIEYVFNSKRIVFHTDSIIEIQIGKGKSSYSTRSSFISSDFGKAVFEYNAINVGRGYKKRLVCRSLNKPILHRTLT